MADSDGGDESANVRPELLGMLAAWSEPLAWMGKRAGDGYKPLP